MELAKQKNKSASRKKLPIYKMMIDPMAEDGSGVNYVALVDEPAIELCWQAFGKHNELKFAADPEKKMVTGPLMVADLPIFRVNKEYGEHYVMFDAQTIEQIVLKFFRQGNQGNVNLMHEKPVDGTFMVESWFVDNKKGKSAPKGMDEVTDGSWYGTFKVENDAVWNEVVKTGIFKGFSVEGMFGYEYNSEDTSDFRKQLTDMINAL